MACVYRCSKCRTRNTFRHAVSWYKVKRKCRGCGHKHFYLDKERTYRASCRCAGAYFWGPHRIGSQYCESNPMHEVHRAKRDGADDGEIAWLGLGLKPHAGDDIPF
jgi:hypothetical protein